MFEVYSMEVGSIICSFPKNLKESHTRILEEKKFHMGVNHSA